MGISGGGDCASKGKVGWNLVGHTGGMARVARDQHVGRGRERIWQGREIGPHRENSHSLQGGTILPHPLHHVCWCLGLGAS